ncbi:MAG: hypothetical protein ACTTH7_09040 [Treponema sp.]
MHTDNNEENQQHKKEAVIAMLSEHWEEFIAALRNRQQHNVTLPYPLQELVMLLSDIVNEQSIDTDAAPYCDDAMLEAADEKGLLEKAKYIILKTHTQPEKKAAPIVNKDGLFVIQNDGQSAELDPVFKDLVDSVL